MPTLRHTAGRRRWTWRSLRPLSRALALAGLGACGERHALAPLPPPAAEASTGAIAASAAGDYTVYADRAAFAAAGTVAFANAFEEFTPNPMHVLPNPWTSKGVQYTSGGNVLVGPALGVGLTANNIMYDAWTPMTGLLAASDAYTMFAVHLSVLGRRDPVDVVLTTNLGSYTFDDLDVPTTDEGRIFFGVVLARAGEHLTGFRFSTTGAGAAPTLTDVTVGHAAASANSPPVASAGGPYAGVEGSAITLALSATDPDGDPITYTWDLGDGTTGNGPTPPAAHTYADDGAYTISITANDGVASDTKTTTATVANAPPKLSAFSAPSDALAAGATVSLGAAFTDAGHLDTHSLAIDCGGGAAGDATAELTAPPDGFASGTCTYSEPGIYTIRLTIADDDGGTDTRTAAGRVVVYDPSAGTLTGGGWIASPPGAFPADPALTGALIFNFIVRYEAGSTAPTGHADFRFQAGAVDFRSTALHWLVITGSQARVEGTGTINGTGSFTFALTAVDDGAGASSRRGRLGTTVTLKRVRLRITDRDTGTLIYDNAVGDVAATGVGSVLGGGSIRVHAN